MDGVFNINFWPGGNQADKLLVELDTYSVVGTRDQDGRKSLLRGFLHLHSGQHSPQPCMPAYSGMDTRRRCRDALSFSQER